MKTAIRITGIHFLLIALLWILANIDSASWCSGTCDTVSYYGALALFFLVYPGLKVAMQLIPYSYSHSSPVPITVWLASAIATEAMLFILIFVLTKIFIRSRKT